jgi:hypothetical protein
MLEEKFENKPLINWMVLEDHEGPREAINKIKEHMRNRMSGRLVVLGRHPDLATMRTDVAFMAVAALLIEGDEELMTASNDEKRIEIMTGRSEKAQQDAELPVRESTPPEEEVWHELCDDITPTQSSPAV